MKDGKQTSDSWEINLRFFHRSAEPKRSGVLDSLTSIIHRGHAQKKVFSRNQTFALTINHY